MNLYDDDLADAVGLARLVNSNIGDPFEADKVIPKPSDEIEKLIDSILKKQSTTLIDHEPKRRKLSM